MMMSPPCDSFAFQQIPAVFWTNSRRHRRYWNRNHHPAASHVAPIALSSSSLSRNQIRRNPDTKGLFLQRNMYSRGSHHKMISRYDSAVKTATALCSSSSRDENSIVGRRKIDLLIRLTPFWTIVAAAIAIRFPLRVSQTIGDLSTMQAAFRFLMISMGVTITPQQLQNAIRQPAVLVLNMLFCFGFMPLLAMGLARGLDMNTSQTIGTVLLGCVSGGQASNVFTLLAGGDVALSVICTLSTTLFGAVATPWLVQKLLVVLGGGAVSTSIAAASSTINPCASMLQSAAQLVLLPVSSGLLLGQLLGALNRKRERSLLQRYCPLVGVLATLMLVAGGASNAAVAAIASGTPSTTTTTTNFGTAVFFASTSASSSWKATFGATVALPIFGAALCHWMVQRFFPAIPYPSRRALVIEVLSKSPTLAHVLAWKHFGSSAAVLPATAMVTLAVLGALLASLYSLHRLPEEQEDL
jgi:BASS family bile acid:Na+ symporter